MVVKKKNFSGQLTPSIIDTHYENCNFKQPEPEMLPTVKGTRIFPGDDTPRHFKECNLGNCEIPPGSTTEGICNRTLSKNYHVSDTQDVYVGLKKVGELNTYVRLVYGHYDKNGKVVLFPTPEEYYCEPPEPE